MTHEAKFRDPEIHCSKFEELSDTRRQLQGPPVNFSPDFCIKSAVDNKGEKRN
jgi:hypothetical protein